MGLSGVSGPFRGAYMPLQFGTASLPKSFGVGEDSQVLWTWTAPFDLEVVDIQVWCASASTNAREHVDAGGASILDPSINSVALYGVGLTTRNSVTATPSTNVFGTTATSITNSVTPSSPGNVINRTRAYGAYVMSGASLSATASNFTAPEGVAGAIIGTLLVFPRTHPSGLRSAFE